MGDEFEKDSGGKVSVMEMLEGRQEWERWARGNMGKRVKKKKIDTTEGNSTERRVMEW